MYCKLCQPKGSDTYAHGNDYYIMIINLVVHKECICI